MNARASAAHDAPMRVPPHIKRLDDCFGDFLARVVFEGDHPTSGISLRRPAILAPIAQPAQQ
jgi:hypothetical protein